MERPNQHEIDTNAQRIFESILPASMVVRKTGSDDYGLDGEIEVFRERKTTGIIFKFQLKGTENPVYIENNTKISLSFPIKNAQYLLEQIDIPTLIIFVDVTSRKVYWLSLQNNQNLVDIYLTAKSENKQSFTIHFSLDKQLPETLADFLDAVHQSRNFLAARAFAYTSSQDYGHYLAGVKDINAEEHHLRTKMDMLVIQKLLHLIHEKNHAEASKLIEEILASSERSAAAKFDAVVQSEDVFVLEDDFTPEDKLSFDVRQALSLRSLALNDTQDLELHKIAEAYVLMATLFDAVSKDLNFYLTRITRQNILEVGIKPTDGYWQELRAIEEANNQITLWELVDKMAQFLYELLPSRYWQFTLYFASKMALNLALTLHRITDERPDDLAKMEQKIDVLIDISITLAEKLNDSRRTDNARSKAIVVYSMMISIFKTNGKDSTIIYQKAKQLLADIADKSLNEELSKALDEEYKKSPQGIKEGFDTEVVEAYYRKQAIRLGVRFDLIEAKISNPYHPLFAEAQTARLIDLGIQDVDPSRVLRSCIYMNVYYSHNVIDMAQRINLFTAGEKSIGCVKHPEHGEIESLSLDTAYKAFQEAHCNTCQDRTPHPNSWQYSEEWHRQQLQARRIAFQEYLEKMNSVEGKNANESKQE